MGGNNDNNVWPEGLAVTPFKHLMALRLVEPNLYESLTKAWAPGFGQYQTAFGGHVYAQSICASGRTVPRGMVLHFVAEERLAQSNPYTATEEWFDCKMLSPSHPKQSITGHFLLPAVINLPFEYRVRRARNGGVYCTRMVEVYQHDKLPEKSTIPCFTATLSFKRDEAANKRLTPFVHQNISPDHIRKEYDNVLPDAISLENGKGLEPPNADAEWWVRTILRKDIPKQMIGPRCPGLEMRKINMEKYNGKYAKGETPSQEQVSRWRQLMFYRLVLGDGDGDGDDDDDYERGSATETGVKSPASGADEDGVLEELNLHAAAHCYTSDRNSLFLIQRAHNKQEYVCPMGSLAHTVIFHGPLHRLRMLDRDRRPLWFVQEAWTSNSGDNRGCHESRLIEHETGTIIATTIQEGMVRVPLEAIDVSNTLPIGEWIEKEFIAKSYGRPRIPPGARISLRKKKQENKL